MFARLVSCALLACALPARAQVAPLEVTVTRADVDDEHVFAVNASGAVQAAPMAVWKVLTNYERMPEFVPDLQTSRVIARMGSDVVVEQFGVARFMFMSRDIHLLVRVTEVPITAIDIGLINGDMKVYSCRWELVPLASGGTRINYTGKMVPRFYVPGFLGANIIRSDIQRMMTAVLARLDKPDQDK
ncbi:MAG: SRPBCC family protein [Pseudomonadota bacterium]